MNNPLPITAFLDTILKGQNALQVNIRQPRVDRLALFLLSRPIYSDDETLIMNYFDVFWLCTTQGDIIGFFASEEEAVHFARDMLDGE